ncbi:MAG TPA: helix-hairpin-helix domain-containing protein [Phycisphaerae bacterium]|nr:helix-hairpin-helix domain-containing protein [Phycisphaerae bacterium]
MIARISGRVEEVTSASVLIDSGGGLCYEVLVAACDVGRLASRLGQEVVLHTIHIIDGDPTRGSLTPRLIGFLSQSDRAFFREFTKVKGIGVRKALRALVRPVAEIAAAIENKDNNALVALPEIGKRMAEQIIAELNGKVGEFAGEVTGSDAEPISDAGMEAVAVLVQLGEKRADAANLVERVLAVSPDATTEDIIQHAYKLKAGGL